ncbi:hypothetical protein D3C78_1684110 [compost metagenome]
MVNGVIRDEPLEEVLGRLGIMLDIAQGEVGEHLDENMRHRLEHLHGVAGTKGDPVKFTYKDKLV